MADNYIKHTRDNGVATLTLNRPDILNSFNRAMARELQGALDAIAADTTVRAVVLTGAGRAFCAGQDLAEAVPPDGAPRPDLGDIVRDSYNPIVRRIRALEKPVIGAVNGVAAGAGANLAFACDILIAAEEATFVQSFSKIGLIPDTGGTFILPRVIGLHRATALMMLAEKLPAAKAMAWGLVHEVVPLAELQGAASKMAQTLAAQATRGFGLTKRALNRSLGSDLETQLAFEEQLQREAGQTADYEEGVRAFLEKRQPRYSGC